MTLYVHFDKDIIAQVEEEELKLPKKISEGTTGTLEVFVDGTKYAIDPDESAQTIRKPVGIYDTMFYPFLASMALQWPDTKSDRLMATLPIDDMNQEVEYRNQLSHLEMQYSGIQSDQQKLSFNRVTLVPAVTALVYHYFSLVEDVSPGYYLFTYLGYENSEWVLLKKDDRIRPIQYGTLSKWSSMVYTRFKQFHFKEFGRSISPLDIEKALETGYLSHMDTPADLTDDIHAFKVAASSQLNSEVYQLTQKFDVDFSVAGGDAVSEFTELEGLDANLNVLHGLKVIDRLMAGKDI